MELFDMIRKEAIRVQDGENGEFLFHMHGSDESAAIMVSGDDEMIGRAILELLRNPKNEVGAAVCSQLVDVVMTYLNENEALKKIALDYFNTDNNAEELSNTDQG